MGMVWIGLGVLGALGIATALLGWEPPRGRPALRRIGPDAGRSPRDGWQDAVGRAVAARLGPGDWARWLGRAGWPYPSVEAFFAHKVAIAALMGGIGGMGGGLFLLLGLPPWIPAAAALGSAGLGFFMPDAAVRAQAGRREDRLLADMALALDRLANLLSAGMPLPQAITALTASQGPFIEELRQVAADYQVSADLVEAVDRMVERNGGLPALVDFASLVRSAAQGGGLAGSLRTLSDELGKALLQRLIERGYRNALLMLLPAFLLMLATLVVLAAPGLMRALQTF